MNSSRSVSQLCERSLPELNVHKQNKCTCGRIENNPFNFSATCTNELGVLEDGLKGLCQLLFSTY